MSEPNDPVKRVLPKRALAVISVFAGLVLLLWCFPAFWYTQAAPDQKYFWLAENRSVDQWGYEEIPVAKSAEATLVADRLVNGEFTNSNRQVVRVFSAKRYQEKQNEIGLFVHTPDRCWTQAGWAIEPVSPDLVEVPLHGIPMRFERRIFKVQNHNELVYFAGLTAGQTLPYRLDHNMSVALKYQVRSLKGDQGAAYRASDSRLWARVLESFQSRRPLLGPKQFVRISTPIVRGDVEAADRLLQSFLAHWLVPVDYQKELQTWQTAQASDKKT